MKYQKTLNDITITIGKNIKHYMKEKNMTQQQLVQKCSDLNLSISQASVSNAINGNSNTTLAVLNKICIALEIELPALFQPIADGTANEHPLHSLPSTEVLLTNPEHRAFQGYLGDYYVYFYKTTGNSPTLTQGKLSFSSSIDKTYCIATLTILTGESRIIHNQEVPIEKKYSGQLFISATMHTAYCQVYSSELGEVYQLLFRHWYLSNNTLKCTMACAVTTCSGSNRRPTIHRICLTREPVTDEKKESLMGQLLLNDGDIIISQSKLKQFTSNTNLPTAFKAALEKSIRGEPYYLFRENLLSTTDISETEQMQLISSLRLFSTAQKYNKISKRTEDVLYTLLYDIDKK